MLAIATTMQFESLPPCCRRDIHVGASMLPPHDAPAWAPALPSRQCRRPSWSPAVWRRDAAGRASHTFAVSGARRTVRRTRGAQFRAWTAFAEEIPGPDLRVSWRPRVGEVRGCQPLVAKAAVAACVVRRRVLCAFRGVGVGKAASVGRFIIRIICTSPTICQHHLRPYDASAWRR
jgi:hypothetical protein